MSALDIFKIVASMLGGLALFLTGMNMMSESLAAMTGGALDRLIGKITKHRFFAFLFGTVLTAIVQSSSAITVLAVGLVNSGIIELSKAAGLVIGANLGTTATAWLLSLNAIDGESFIMTIIKPASFSPFLAIVGVAMTMFCRSEKKKTIGSALLGFAVMMIGMNLMSQAVSPLREVPAIQNTLVSFTNPILGFLFACAFAMLIQSSDAVIGILQAFAMSMGITFGMAIPLICGAQVGTCITAVLSSLGASNNGKRTALLNLYYNLLKTIPFLIIFYLLNSTFGFSILGKEVGGIGIPVFHTFVNLLGTVIWLPLSGVIVGMAKRTIPLSERELQEQANVLTMLDKNLLGAPSVALEQADRAVILLSTTVGDAFKTVIGMREDPALSAKVGILCERSAKYREQIDDYLMQISERDISIEERELVTLLSSSNTAFGRMGKVAERIHGYVDQIAGLPDKMSVTDRREINILGEAIYEIMQLTISGFSARTKTISNTIRYYREEIMELGEMIKYRFIRRYHTEGRERRMSTLYTDICYAQEQLIDYCDMIAEALIRYDSETGDNGTADTANDERMRKQIHEIFRDKFEVLENISALEESGEKTGIALF